MALIGVCSVCEHGCRFRGTKLPKSLLKKIPGKGWDGDFQQKYGISSFVISPVVWWASWVRVWGVNIGGFWVLILVDFGVNIGGFWR